MAIQPKQREEREMRKIEKEMCAAIANGVSSWKGKNTSVERNNDGWNVYLHGNWIARVYVDNSGETNVRFNLCGWETRTTYSRINALLSRFRPGEYIARRKGDNVFFRNHDAVSGFAAQSWFHARWGGMIHKV